VTVRDLLKAALRHRPDRIIVGEVRGGEAFDLLQALNTGHAGSLCTLHANSARQNTIQLEDEAGSIWNYLPLGCEAQMFAIVTCRGGCGRSPHFIGVGSPLNDGKQYLLESEAWCFWCFPREHFTEEELPLIRQQTGLVRKRRRKSSILCARMRIGRSMTQSNRLKWWMTSEGGFSREAELAYIGDYGRSVSRPTL
jgi:hypothetical protein